MTYKKPAAKKPWTGNKGGGGYQKKEFDPTIVSAKDIGIARANAVTAIHTLAAAHVAAGSEVPFDIDAEVERIFEESVAKFDHPRIGSATKTSASTETAKPAKKSKEVTAAEKAVRDGLGEEDDDDVAGETDDDEIPYANLEIRGGKHAGNTIADIYENDEEEHGDEAAEKGYVAWMATDKNKNDYTRKAAKAFLKATLAAA